MIKESKPCIDCGEPIFRPNRTSKPRWDKRKRCKLCNAKYMRNLLKREAEKNNAIASKHRSDANGKPIKRGFYVFQMGRFIPPHELAYPTKRKNCFGLRDWELEYRNEKVDSVCEEL